MTGEIQRYVLKQRLEDGRVWTSPEIFEARSTHEIRQAVLAGFLRGFARWAETPPAEHCAAYENPGFFLFGIDSIGRLSDRPGSDHSQFQDW